ncbi:primosomal protein N' family DNA-binding protein [Dermacoccus nishinomiyaensis]
MTSDDVHAASSEQLALLRDAVRAKARGDDAGSAKVATGDGGSERVAVVWPMLEVPHLDREFEYRIPAELADDVRFGVAVKVRFHGKRITGYVVGVRETPEFTGTLSPLLAVVSPEAVLTEHIWQVAQAVAARMGGTVSDVLRLAIPPRHARAEKALDERMAKASAADQSVPEVAEAENAGPDAASAVPG